MATEPKDAPKQLGQWLDHLGATPRLNSYADHDALAKRMQQVNPRLSDEEGGVPRASAEAGYSTTVAMQMACDPWHRVPAPILYRIDDQLAAWNTIEAPVLMLLSDEGFVHERFGDDPVEQERRLAAFRNLQVETIGDCSHNLQHDQPA